MMMIESLFLALIWHLRPSDIILLALCPLGLDINIPPEACELTLYQTRRRCHRRS